jgi:hypothetical protein
MLTASPRGQAASDGRDSDDGSESDEVEGVQEVAEAEAPPGAEAVEEDEAMEEEEEEEATTKVKVALPPWMYNFSLPSASPAATLRGVAAAKPAKRSAARRAAAPKTAAGKRASLRCAAAAAVTPAACAAARREANARSHARGVQRSAVRRAAADLSWATGMANGWTREELAELQRAADAHWRPVASQSGIRWAVIKRLAQAEYPLLVRHLHTNNANTRTLGKKWNALAALGLVLSPSRPR